MQEHHTAIAAAIGHRDRLRTTCPECSQSRKKKSDPCLSIDRKEDGALAYICHHCGMSGAIDNKRTHIGRTYVTSTAVAAPQSLQAHAPAAPVITLPSQPLAPLDAAYLSSRGLSEATWKAAGLTSTRKFFSAARSELPCIAFPYRLPNGQTISHKYRTDTKHFTQDSGGAQTFYGLDRLNISIPTLLITEGEIDALSLTEAGFDNAVSVPNGAPMKIVNKKVTPEEDAKFSYVWEARDILAKMDRVVLVTDADSQGTALQEELARRIGKHKCWIVSYPEGCKDANDVLLKHGKTVLSDIIIDAKPYPISALYSANDFAQDIETLYNKRSIRGASTGFRALDHLYTVYPGQVTIVTGLPSHGKSSFVDQMCVNLANQYSWKTAFCSFENQPSIHIAHLMELKIGKPFFQPKQENMDRIDKQEYAHALEWVSKHFGFIDFRDTEPPTIDNILQRAQAAIQRIGVRGLVIDPYNYVRMNRNQSETDEIGDMLTRVQAFAKANDCHVWFVAHPTKMYGAEASNRPGGMNISGSMAWWAKADCGVTVHRGQQPDQTVVDIWKCRYRWVGQQGSATVSYDELCGGFSG